MITKPLLAETCSSTKTLKYPIYCTPKIDGGRVLKVNGNVVTRNFKPVPNRYIRSVLESILPDGMDGEILAGENEGNFQEVMSAMMSFDGEPKFHYHAFDYVTTSLDKPYKERMQELHDWYNAQLDEVKAIVKPLFPVLINNEAELLSYEQECLGKGYEGVMIRSLNGRYKCGRSSEKEGILLKLKRFMDSEAIIEGFEELMHNENVAKKNVFGRTERSSEKAGMVPSGTLGALLVRDVYTDIPFKIGSGFDQKMRQKIWDNREAYLGQYAKYKSFSIGVKEAPRFPIFLGMRPKEDMSN